MKYVLLIYGSDRDWTNLSDEDRNAMYAEYEAVARDSAVIGGAELQAATTATTVRVNGGGDPVTTDGPFAETKEQLGGYFVVDCDDIDQAITLAARIPAARHGSVEVRPLVDRGAPA